MPARAPMTRSGRSCPPAPGASIVVALGGKALGDVEPSRQLRLAVCPERGGSEHESGNGRCSLKRIMWCPPTPEGLWALAAPRIRPSNSSGFDHPCVYSLAGRGPAKM